MRFLSSQQNEKLHKKRSILERVYNDMQTVINLNSAR